MVRPIRLAVVAVSCDRESRDRERAGEGVLEKLPVRRPGGFAVPRPRLLARTIGGLRLERAGGAGLEHGKRLAALALDRAHPEWHPLRWLLEAMRLRVAPRVGLGEVARLDPHS